MRTKNDKVIFDAERNVQIVDLRSFKYGCSFDGSGLMKTRVPSLFVSSARKKNKPGSNESGINFPTLMRIRLLHFLLT